MQLILHMAMALRGHVVLDPGWNGRRFVRQIGFIIRLLNKRFAHQIPRASCNAAIGSYLSGSSPGSDLDKLASALAAALPADEPGFASSRRNRAHPAYPNTAVPHRRYCRKHGKTVGAGIVLDVTVGMAGL